MPRASSLSLTRGNWAFAEQLMGNHEAMNIVGDFHDVSDHDDLAPWSKSKNKETCGARLTTLTVCTMSCRRSRTTTIVSGSYHYYSNCYHLS